MQIFDRLNPNNLEARELQLLVLTGGVILILTVGLALLMYPAILSQQLVISGRSLRILFFGFCALSVLMVGYLVERQLTIRRLRRKLIEELKRNAEVRREASADLLTTLPRIQNFKDRVAMECRRSASMERPLSVVVVSLVPSRRFSDAGEATAAFGDAAKAMSRRLRQEDSIYLFCPGLFGVVLPGVDAATASRVADRLAGGLTDAAGASNRFVSNLQVVNYPAHVATANQLEQAVLSLLPENVPGHLESSLVAS